MADASMKIDVVASRSYAYNLYTDINENFIFLALSLHIHTYIYRYIYRYIYIYISVHIGIYKDIHMKLRA